MALERKFFFGFQTGGEEEFAGGTASGSVRTSPATWSDKEANYCYRLTWKQQLHAPVTYVPGTLWNTVSFNVRFEEPNQGQDTDFYLASDGAGGFHLRLRIPANTNGDLAPINANGLVIPRDGGLPGTIENVFAADTWYRVTIKYSVTDSGAFRLWVAPSAQRWNGAPIHTAAASDCDTDVNSVQHQWRNTGWTDGIAAAIFFGSTYCFTDTEGSIDTERILGSFVTLGPYNDAFHGSISNFGDNLTSGRWDNIVDVPVVDGDLAEYELSTGTSVREGGVTANDISGHIGPLGDSRVDGTLLQMMGVFRAKKSGTGMAITFYGKYGAAVPADFAVDRTQTINFGALTTSFQNFVHFSTVVPSTTAARYAQIGMKAQRVSGLFGTSAQMAMGAVYFLHEEPRLLIVDGKSQLIGA